MIKKSKVVLPFSPNDYIAYINRTCEDRAIADELKTFVVKDEVISKRAEDISPDLLAYIARQKHEN